MTAAVAFAKIRNAISSPSLQPNNKTWRRGYKSADNSVNELDARAAARPFRVNLKVMEAFAKLLFKFLNLRNAFPSTSDLQADPETFGDPGVFFRSAVLSTRCVRRSPRFLSLDVAPLASHMQAGFSSAATYRSLASAARLSNAWCVCARWAACLLETCPW